MFNTIDSDLIRGHIDTIILKALYEGDRYGFDIIKEVEQKSGGQYVIKQPTLYSCLKRLETQGFIKSYWGTKSIGGRRKYFTLTDMGRELFTQNLQNWEYSRTVIDKLILDRTDFQTVSESASNSTFYNSNNAETEIESEILQDDQENYMDEFESYDENLDNSSICDETGFSTNHNCEEIQNDLETFQEEQYDSSNYVFINADEVQNEENDNNGFVEPSQELFVDYASKDDYNSDTQSDNNDISCDAIYIENNETEKTNESELERDEDVNINEVFSRLYAQNSNEKSYLNTLETEEYIPAKKQSNVSNFFTELEYEDVVEEELTQPAPVFDVSPVDDIAATDDAVILDKQEPESFSSSEFLSYHSPANKLNFDEEGDEYILDRDYKKVIEELIEKNTVKTSDYDDYDLPQKENFVEFSTEKIIKKDFDKLVSNIKDMGDDIDVKTHNSAELRKYSEKNYYYSNQLRLFHYGILFGLMLLEIVACFFIIELGIKSNLPIEKSDALLYLAAVLFALAFPVGSVIVASTDYYRKKRFSFSLKSAIIFRLIIVVQCIVIIYALNVYNGIITGNTYNYLSSLILPSVLSLNLMVSPLLYNYLFNTKRFAVK